MINSKKNEFSFKKIQEDGQPKHKTKLANNLNKYEQIQF